ncbi:hypothetical protein C9374_008769 [Naegleria lovaniensis]|uniref:Uncharacterized protein n=1 Tax=Naegleria lovaniensis TaxID=51637 RepID=A0AA88KFA0_NAELO|nr:uncharacterized protein C9374_008769 [Naegleria lovaniensis]KAG2378147.1 hypothetical protein C9374_008769 [Naegleria lovaniensis]
MISYCSTSDTSNEHGCESTTTNPFDGSVDMSKHFNIHAIPNIRIHTKQFSPTTSRRAKPQPTTQDEVKPKGIQKKTSCKSSSQICSSQRSIEQFSTAYFVQLYNNNNQPREVTTQVHTHKKDAHHKRSTIPHIPHLPPSNSCTTQHSETATTTKKVRTSISIQELLNA